MTATISYEVHVMRSGRWVTAGVYQDKGDALRDARGVMRRRYLGIRVIEEIFDPARDRYVTRTIYRDQARTEPPGGGRDTANVGTFACAMKENIAGFDHPFKMAAFALIGMSSIMLAGIFGLFWLGLV